MNAITQMLPVIAFERVQVDDNLSYWQRGCNDAKAGKPRTPPFTRDQREHPPTGWTWYGMKLACEGYEHGYCWGSRA